MSVEFVVDKENDILVRTMKGQPSPAEILASLDASIRHPDYRPGMPSLIDMREFSLDSSSADIRQLAGFLTEHKDSLWGMKAAVVVSRAVDYGLTRMLQALAESPDLSIAVFYEIDEARRWLEALKEAGSSPPDSGGRACERAPGGPTTAG